MTERPKQKVRVMRYGGIKYVHNVPREEIISFIDNLPEEKKRQYGGTYPGIEG